MNKITVTMKDLRASGLSPVEYQRRAEALGFKVHFASNKDKRQESRSVFSCECTANGFCGCYVDPKGGTSGIETV